MWGSGITVTLMPVFFSIFSSWRRLLFKMKVAISTGAKAMTSPVCSLCASSSTRRMIDNAKDAVSLIVPWPWHIGHTWLDDSSKDGRNLWRDISKRPKREIRENWMRARSWRHASRIRFSISLWFLIGLISIKSITTNPPTSRKRNWRAISSAASILVCSAVSSISPPRVALAELTSIEVRASVGSITIAPPDGKRTSRK